MRREHPALQDDRREALEAHRDGAALVLRRWNAGREVAIVALFSEKERSVALPEGRWRILLDSGTESYGVPGAKSAVVEGSTLRLCGRHAVVVERTA